MIAEFAVGVVAAGAAYVAGRLKNRSPAKTKRPKCSSQSGSSYAALCPARADPRCVADNCTMHCRQHCGKRCES